MNDKMEISAEEFVRRFAHHICDKGFIKVRHGGIYGNAVKKENVKNARRQVYGSEEKPVQIIKEVWKLKRRINKIIDSISICNKCGAEMINEAIEAVEAVGIDPQTNVITVIEIFDSGGLKENAA